jgi:hypothetical protein
MKNIFLESSSIVLTTMLFSCSTLNDNEIEAKDDIEIYENVEKNIKSVFAGLDITPATESVKGSCHIPQHIY